MNLIKVNYQIPGTAKIYTAFFDHSSIQEVLAASDKIARATVISSESQEFSINNELFFDKTGELLRHAVEAPEIIEEHHEKMEKAMEQGDVSRAMKLSGINDWF
jgi:hypothetical protein